MRGGAGREVTIVVKRQDSELAVVATPRTNPPPGEGALGILLRATVGPAPFHLAVPRAFQRTWDAVLLLSQGHRRGDCRHATVGDGWTCRYRPDRRRRRAAGPRDRLHPGRGSSPPKSACSIWRPWPGLDGGRLIFVLVELLTGRRVPPRREAAFHFVGIMVLLTLVLVITVGDVQRIAGA